jgi:hypothetical protein
MLDSPAAWNAGGFDGHEWIQIDLGSNFRVHGVVIQARANYPQWVTEIEVEYSTTMSNFVKATATGGGTRFFPTSTYSNQIKSRQHFDQPVVAQYIKIVVYAGHAAMRAGVLTSLTTATWDTWMCAECEAGKYQENAGVDSVCVRGREGKVVCVHVCVCVHPYAYLYIYVCVYVCMVSVCVRVL